MKAQKWPMVHNGSHLSRPINRRNPGPSAKFEDIIRVVCKKIKPHIAGNLEMWVCQKAGYP